MRSTMLLLQPYKHTWIFFKLYLSELKGWIAIKVLKYVIYFAINFVKFAVNFKGSSMAKPDIIRA